jgi:hypothetical protein
MRHFGFLAFWHDKNEAFVFGFDGNAAFWNDNNEAFLGHMCLGLMVLYHDGEMAFWHDINAVFVLGFDGMQHDDKMAFWHDNAAFVFGFNGNAALWHSGMIIMKHFGGIYVWV